MTGATNQPKSMWERFSTFSPMQVIGGGSKAIALAATLSASGYLVSAPSTAQAEAASPSAEAYSVNKDVESYGNYLDISRASGGVPSFERGKISLVDFAAENGLSGADAMRAAQLQEGVRMGLGQIPGLDGQIANRSADLRPMSEQMVTYNLLRQSIGERPAQFAEGTGERKQYHSMGRWAEEQALSALEEGRMTDARRLGNFALTSISEMQRMPDENRVDLTATSLSQHASQNQLRGPEALEVARAQAYGERGLGAIDGIDMERAESWAALGPKEFAKKAAAMVVISSGGGATAQDAGFNPTKNPDDLYKTAASWGERMALRAQSQNDPMAARYAEFALAGMSAQADLAKSRQRGAPGAER